MPVSGPISGAEQFGVAAQDRRDGAQVGGVGRGRPANAAASSANSHGRPWQPRPTTTPSQPVAAIIAQRVGRGEDVAVAQHRHAASARLLEPCAIASQSAVPE